MRWTRRRPPRRPSSRSAYASSTSGWAQWSPRCARRERRACSISGAARAACSRSSSPIAGSPASRAWTSRTARSRSPRAGCNSSGCLPTQRQRIDLFQGSLLYRDARLAGFDAAAVVEVIEHLDDDRLAAFERVVFEYARPRTIVVTTPNAEFNANWESLPAGEFRHRDHRFEWTRDEFSQWAGPLGERHGYEVRYLPVGPDQPDTGAPTQMAIFQQGDV